MYRTLLLTTTASYPNGSWRPMAPLPDDAYADGWGALLDRAARRMHDSSVLLLTAGVAERAGFPMADHPKHLPEGERAAAAALGSARVAGWSVSKVAPWMTFHAPGRPTIHVGVLEWMTEEDLPAQPTQAVDAEMAAVETAAYLHAWQDATGASWHGTAAVAGTALLQAAAHGAWDRRQNGYRVPKWQLDPDQVPREWQGTSPVTVRSWRPTPRPTGHAYEHTFDVNKQWLAAAPLCMLAHGHLTRARISFDPKRAGMWLVDLERWPHDHIPNPAGPRQEGKPVWLSTPALQLVHQLTERTDQFQHPGYAILDAWTAPGNYVLADWAAALRVVVEDFDLGPAAKAVYARSLPHITKPGEPGARRRVFRPDWARGVQELAYANLWRKVLKVGLASGRWPVMVSADQVTYASAAADWRDDIPAGLELDDTGRKVGKLKYKEPEQ